MTSQKYAHADDLAFLCASRDWKAVEDTLSQDMATLSAYLHRLGGYSSAIRKR